MEVETLELNLGELKKLSKKLCNKRSDLGRLYRYLYTTSNEIYIRSLSRDEHYDDNITILSAYANIILYLCLLEKSKTKDNQLFEYMSASSRQLYDLAKGKEDKSDTLLAVSIALMYKLLSDYKNIITNKYELKFTDDIKNVAYYCKYFIKED